MSVNLSGFLHNCSYQPQAYSVFMKGPIHVHVHVIHPGTTWDTLLPSRALDHVVHKPALMC